MGRSLGIDYGLKRIGLALSDPLGIFASGLKTIPNQSLKQIFKDLKTVIQTYEVDTLVIGLPLRTSGEMSETAEKVKQFGEELSKETGLNVLYEDERFTSVIAEKALREQGVQPFRHKNLIDQTSAALILQQYLDKAAKNL